MTEFAEICSKAGSITRDELVRIKEKYPMYANAHEGYAVLLEEIEEAQEMLKGIESYTAMLWEAVKNDNHKEIKRTLTKIGNFAINGCAELVQVAAVTQKFAESEAKNE